jgi:hypothetical protein
MKNSFYIALSGLSIVVLYINNSSGPKPKRLCLVENKLYEAKS